MVLPIMRGVRAAIITVSTRTARGESEDVSGPRLAALAEAAGAIIAACEVVPDARLLIESRLPHQVASGCSFIFTPGGAGCPADDVTPEATRAVIDRDAPGFAETM